MTVRTVGLSLIVLVGVVSPVASAQTRTVSVGDATLAYEAHGAGKPIVFIHGWAQDHAIWPDQVKAFSSNYRVITYDKRGFGESTGHADPTADPDDLRILLDSLGVRSVYVVGLSRGARTALNFSVAFPERVAGVVLYGLGPIPGFQPLPQGRMMQNFAQIARDHGLDSLYHAVFSSPLAWEPAGLTDEQKRARVARNRTWWARYKGRDLLDPRPPSGRIPVATLEQLNGIRVPTLLLHGDHEMASNQAMADTAMGRIRGARKVVITNAGHGAHFDNPRQFNDAVLAFFRSLDARR
jgi:3-oxoadipate enol-lactonase